MTVRAVLEVTSRLPWSVGVIAALVAFIALRAVANIELLSRRLPASSQQQEGRGRLAVPGTDLVEA